MYPFLVNALSKLRTSSRSKTLCFECDMWHALHTVSHDQGRVSLGHGLGTVSHDHRNPISFSLTTLGHPCKQPLCYSLTTFTILPLVKTHFSNTFSSKGKFRPRLDSTSLWLRLVYHYELLGLQNELFVVWEGKAHTNWCPHPFKLVRGPS